MKKILLPAHEETRQEREARVAEIARLVKTRKYLLGGLPPSEPPQTVLPPEAREDVRGDLECSG